MQLLHGDDRRGAADAGGADAHLLPQQGAGVGGVLPVALNLHRVVKIGRDLLTAAGITGQEAVPPHVARLTLNMKLPFVLVHNILLAIGLQYLSIIADFRSVCKIDKPEANL